MGDVQPFGDGPAASEPSERKKERYSHVITPTHPDNCGVYGYIRDPKLPPFLYGPFLDTDSGTDSEMPLAVCGWCRGTDNCGVHSFTLQGLA